MTRITARLRKTPNLSGSIGGWGNRKRFTREFLAKVGFEVEAEAKRRAPVDHGRLKGSISTAWRGRPGQASSVRNYTADRRDAVSTPSRDMRVHVGSNVEYARFVHERHATKPRFLARAMRTVQRKVARIGGRFDSRER